MKHQLIGKDSVAYAAKIGGGTIASSNETNLLASGAIALFDPNGVLITTGNSTTILNGQTEFYMALGSGSAATGAKISGLIKKNLDYGFVKQSYTAPTAQVSFIGQNSVGGGSMNFPTFVPGDEAIITIVYGTTLEGIQVGTNTAFKQRYSYVVNASDTNATIVAGLIAEVNADANALVSATAVGSNVGIQLTGKSPVVTNLFYNNDNKGPLIFQLATDGLAINADVYATGLTGTDGSVNAFAGFGTPAELLASEDETSYYEGKSQGIMLPQIWWSVASLVDPSETYDTYVAQWTPTRSSGQKLVGTTEQQLLVALPNGATDQANFETILTNLGLL